MSSALPPRHRLAVVALMVVLTGRNDDLSTAMRRQPVAQ
jgi:hypothetical protein